MKELNQAKSEFESKFKEAQDQFDSGYYYAAQSDLDYIKLEILDPKQNYPEFNSIFHSVKNKLDKFKKLAAECNNRIEFGEYKKTAEDYLEQAR